MSGNRCGHNPGSLRTCDIVSRGKGGHPQLLGVISAYLVHAARDRRLRALDKLNASGRRKRTEQIEAITAVCGFLVARFFQPDTRRCVMPTAAYLVAPDAAYIARQVNKSDRWAGSGQLSTDRVYAALGNLERAGYLTKTAQTREQLPSGDWIAKPRILAFTKKFFLHLGGARLWQTVRQRGRALVGRIREAIEGTGQTLREVMNPGLILSPGQAHEWHKRTGEPRVDSLSVMLQRFANNTRRHAKAYRHPGARPV